MEVRSQQRNSDLVISQEEFIEWQNNVITKEVVKQIINTRDVLKNHLAAGGTLQKNSLETTDRIVGRIEGLLELFNLFTDIKEEMEEKPQYGH